jgi:ParB-like chromosome segregation protein Spo0J
VNVSTISLLPALTPEEYESLKADITTNGILVPIIRTEDGETIDGHHREQIAAELGISDIPVKTIDSLGDEERRHMRIRLNANRRQLTGEQKRHLIREELRKSPDISNNWLAQLLGVDDKTVQAVRIEEEQAGTI